VLPALPATREPTASPAPGRLLDLGLAHASAAVAGRAERYGRGETAHTIHVWWARRPHAAMRALVFAALCKDQGPAARDLLDRLGRSATVAPEVLAAGQALLAAQYPARPALLDMFSGGGTIPLEALRLGADAHAVELNQLAAFLATCNLVYSQEAGVTGDGMAGAAGASDPAALLDHAGARVLDRLADYTRAAFPLRDAPVRAATYFWTYRTPCPDCGHGLLLCRRPWLSRRRGVAVRVIDTAEGQRAVLAADPGAHEPGLCPRCGHAPGAVSGAVSIAHCEDALVAVASVNPTPRRGKHFDVPPARAVPARTELLAMETALLADLGVSLPVSRLPRWSGIVNPALHGMDTHADVFQPRQRIVLLALIKALREEHRALAAEHGEPVARWVVSALGALIDQCVDWNCRLSMWIPANEQVGRAFCGPGVAMLWDWAETDPVGPGPSNLHGKLARLVAGARWIGRLPRPATVLRAAAQSLPHPAASFDAVVTDPPYYDNLYYSVLADFFYPWKRMLLAGVAPELFTEPTTETERELVASTQRSGDPAAAHARYVTELAAALTEAARVMKPDAVLALVYGHSAARRLGRADRGICSRAARDHGRASAGSRARAAAARHDRAGAADLAGAGRSQARRAARPAQRARRSRRGLPPRHRPVQRRIRVRPRGRRLGRRGHCPGRLCPRCRPLGQRRPAPRRPGRARRPHYHRARGTRSLPHFPPDPPPRPLTRTQGGARPGDPPPRRLNASAKAAALGGVGPRPPAGRRPRTGGDR
jgi:putative DNA methylase